MKRFLFALSMVFLHSTASAGIPIQHWTLDNGAKVYLVEKRLLLEVLREGDARLHALASKLAVE